MLSQAAEPIAEWVAKLRERFGGRPVAVCIEQSRGALIFALMQYDFLMLCPINPSQLSAYRRALYPSGAKDDPTDAELIARFGREHFDRLRVWRPDDENSRVLRFLTEQRREWVGQRVALENQLRQRLKEAFPQALQFYGSDLHGEPFLAFLTAFPSLKELQRASPRQLSKWLPKRRHVADGPSQEQILYGKLQSIRKALPLTKDIAVLEHARLAIRHAVIQIRSLNQAIAESEQKIAEFFLKHPDRELFASLPGAGPTLAPRLAAAFGTNREKFDDAGDIQAMSGIAPVTRSSGKTTIVQARWACPRFLRQTFHEFARCSAFSSAWAKAYVTMRKAHDTPYHVIIRALAFKWQRILFRCWKNREVYNEDRYLESLRRSNAKLLAYLPPSSGEKP
jgi:transposase